MSLSNYFTSLDFDLEQTTIAVSETEHLLRVHESAFIRATQQEREAREHLFRCQKIAADKKETFRDTSIVHAALKKRLGELQGERFLNDEEMEDWRDTH